MVRGVEMEPDVAVLSRSWREGALFVKSNGKCQIREKRRPK
jgi:hypothetical protein